MMQLNVPDPLARLSIFFSQIILSDLVQTTTGTSKYLGNQEEVGVVVEVNSFFEVKIGCHAPLHNL